MYPIILVDMDGVICDFVHGFYEIARHKFPDVYEQLPEPNKLSEFYIENEIKDPVIKQRATKIIEDPQLFYMLPPIENAVNGMKYLRNLATQNGMDVFICSAPHGANKDSYKAKAEWVGSFLGHDWMNRLMLVRDKTLCNGAVLVDDRPEVMGSYKNTWEHVLFRQSYNEHVIGKIVMTNWSDECVECLVEYTLSL